MSAPAGHGQPGETSGELQGEVIRLWAEADGLLPGGQALSRAEWAERVAGWFPELVNAKARSLTFPEINRLRRGKSRARGSWPSGISEIAPPP